MKRSDEITGNPSQQSTCTVQSILKLKQLKANIAGPADLYVKSGSDINLQCKISQGPHELGNIFWYKEPRRSCIRKQISIPIIGNASFTQKSNQKLRVNGMMTH
ncbi:hypothetical protein Bhyg_17711 [Pseudolycoriella hygida]|uniref:Ig-like domain-containing protein n=1 Tax=Pseudolycoriella hygida TaxID=35572 RepID=A0A9Q0MMT4_9DIPT|nr:hypothetical protein Bhyg_17711 [Pseudolycoriella hygida]